jgi:hypothetical protein
VGFFGRVFLGEFFWAGFLMPTLTLVFRLKTASWGGGRGKGNINYRIVIWRGNIVRYVE